MGIDADIQTLEPGSLVVLFELDASDIGGEVIHFHGYDHTGPIVWQGVSYEPWPIEAEGFEITGEAQQPAPTLRVGNLNGSIGALTAYQDDLLGAKITRRRTMAKYLDAVNFPDGNPEADPDQRFPDDIFLIEAKTHHDKMVIEFELRSALDLSHVFLPRRLILPNLCSWTYRSSECGYVGGPVADEKDVPTSDPARDRCSKSLTGCKLRWGEYGVLPFGGYPGASLRGI